jgi:hypothetical protein
MKTLFLFTFLFIAMTSCEKPGDDEKSLPPTHRSDYIKPAPTI